MPPQERTERRLRSPYELYWQFRLEAFSNRLRYQRQLLGEWNRLLGEWQERAEAFARERKEAAEEAAEEGERETRGRGRRRGEGEESPRG